MQGGLGRHLGLFFPLRVTEANSRPGLTNDHEEDSNDDLQEQRDADEGDEGGIVLRGRPLLQHRFQPHGVGHEESHVQHALCHTLLGGIMVQVDGLAPLGVWGPRLQGRNHRLTWEALEGKQLRKWKGEKGFKALP